LLDSLLQEISYLIIFLLEKETTNHGGVL